MIRSPVWVSIEGVNGVGKTHLARLLSARLGAQAQLVSELTDDGDDPVIRDVVSALSVGRSFLRTGQPLTETLALLALKVREYERVTMMPTPPPVVIEDRGVDTVACYQAPILADVIDGAEPSTDAAGWPSSSTRPPRHGGRCRTARSCSSMILRCVPAVTPPESTACLTTTNMRWSRGRRSLPVARRARARPLPRPRPRRSSADDVFDELHDGSSTPQPTPQPTAAIMSPRPGPLLARMRRAGDRG